MAESGPAGFEANSVSSALTRAVYSLMLPLVRLLLEKQLTYASLMNLLKRVYVEVAGNEMVIEGRRQTDSRISLLTGIHRKDIKRLRKEIADDVSMPNHASLGALVVSRWTGSPDFLDSDGNPIPLERSSVTGPSFESLVSSVNSDIPACSVLDEWLRLGVAVRDDHDRICLSETSFIPDQGLEEKLHFFGRNLHDHIATGAHNVLGEGPPFLDRSVYYDKLSPESVQELAELARVEGAALLQRINQRALELQQRSDGSADATHRITMGTYFFSADVPADTD
ncbi:MAG: hypothetical protein JRG89_13030 [Deltaproteobacteria bacterium]|nr:hypothetical protein [Deltaproteobacteria bacterium]